MYSAPVQTAITRVLSRYAAPPRLSVSDWLDAHRTLSRAESPMPGPWRTDRAPFLRGPLEAFADPAVDTIVLMFSSQVGKTEALLGMLLYAFSVDPAPGMLVLPTLELAGGVSTDRLTPALRGCDALDGLVGEGAKKSDNAVLHKRINAAPLSLVGANAPTGLSSRPVRYLFCDEIDRFPAATPEGDPLSLARQRTAAYRRRKVVLTSTPTIKGVSRVEDWYERSDRRVYEVPCPRCGAAWTPKWADVRWTTGDVESAHLSCPHCNGRVEDHERAEMFQRGSWTATAADTAERGLVGFRIWAVASPWVRLSELVTGFLAAKDNVETLKAWVNLTLGESWEDPGSRVEPDVLVARAEASDWWETLPVGCLALTCGVDTQDDRLEALVVGWGAGEESWLISRELHPGDPNTSAPWRSLDQTLGQVWRHAEGYGLRIACTFVDAGGHKTDAVYRETRARSSARVFTAFGRAGGERGQFVSPPKQLDTPFGQVTRYIFDADAAKSLIHSRLRLAPGLPGSVHIAALGAESLVSELTAEVLMTKANKFGVPTRTWVRTGRNESLDCFAMATAAMRTVAPTPARLQVVNERTRVRKP